MKSIIILFIFALVSKTLTEEAIIDNEFLSKLENLDINTEELITKAASKKKETTATTAQPKCLSPGSADTVDYFFLFLMKKQYNKFVYMDDTMKKTTTYDKTSATFSPLQMALELNNKKTNFIVWNDEKLIETDPAFSTISHSKGMISYNENGGYLLIHSLPKFPAANTNKEFLDEFSTNEGKFAQTFICLSLDHSNLNKVLTQLKSVKPGIQVYNMEHDFNTENDSILKELLNTRKRIKEDAILNSSILTLNKKKFDFFSKPKPVNTLPWDSAIPLYYKEDFYVGTWTRPALLDNICDGDYKIFNILNYEIDGMKYSNNEDHSKWAYSSKVFCVGDLNRTESQLTRSGNVLCLEDSKIAKIVGKYNVDYNKCANEKQNKKSFLSLVSEKQMNVNVTNNDSSLKFLSNE